MEHKSFLIVSKELLADKRISITDTLLLAWWQDYLGVSISTVKRSLRKLRACGLLEARS
jgi:predicted transcriptional regulator